MMQVAGGTYLEFCREPHWYELFGSGLRASLALAQLGVPVWYSTFIGPRESAVLEAKTASIEMNATATEETVSFNYLHPLSKPAIEPDAYVRSCQVHPKEIVVDSDKVLRFGVVEGSFKIKAHMATYDPQTPSDPRPFGENGSTAERLAVVANGSEARRLTGKRSPEEAGKALVDGGAEVAIVKLGSAGCAVATMKGIERVPAFRTNQVWPIGSGDVFSALFARGWMELGMDPVEAATIASKGTSHFVRTKLAPTQDDLEKGTFEPLRTLPREKHKQIYLAGPFFNLPQRWLIEEFLKALRDAHVQVFSPLHDVGRGAAEAVYGPDIEGLKKCSVVLACLDGLDPGTVYEVGYAHSLGAKVIAFVSAERQEDLKMVVGGGSVVTHDFATALYLTVWAATCE